MTSVSQRASSITRGKTDYRPAALRAVGRPLHRASTLPGPMFTDPRIFSQEARTLFLNSWVCVGRADEVAGPGHFRTYEIGGSGVIVLRGQDGTLRAFHNVCRHRGTRILEGVSGFGLSLLQCPYHAWTYGLDGRLVGAPHMDAAEDFDRAEFGLYPVALAEWRGFLFLNLGRNPVPLSKYLGDFQTRAAPYPLERLRLAHRIVYEIAANWKLVIQNANECDHCPGVHPQLVCLTPYRSGEEDLREGPVFDGWMDFVDGARTLTATGRTERQRFPSPGEQDSRRVYYYILYPSNFLILLPDYVALDWFIPLSPERTRLVFDLYVDREETDSAKDAMDFWDVTNRQDWHICEMAHLGSKSVAYTQGRYSSEEEVVHLIDRYYLKRMGLLRPPRTRRRRA